MEHKIINRGDYLLIVDDSEIKVGDYCLMFDDYGNSFLGNTPQKYLGESAGHFLNKGLKKLISHLPLNNSPILEGVDLLPPIEEIDIVEKAIEFSKLPFEGAYNDKKYCMGKEIGFIGGYNKAKEKYKYTEEDLKDIWEYVKNNRVTYKEYLQSLQQSKMPVGFKCETIDEAIRNVGEDINGNNAFRYEPKLKTTTNSQDLTQWIGEYTF